MRDNFDRYAEPPDRLTDAAVIGCIVLYVVVVLTVVVGLVVLAWKWGA